jgi:hypothetical protein
MTFSLEHFQKMRLQLEALNVHLTTNPGTRIDPGIPDEIQKIHDTISHTKTLVLGPGYKPPSRPEFPRVTGTGFKE